MNQTSKTKVAPDTKPPASISNLQNTTGTTWINWSRINPSDADFNFTMVFLNGTRKTNTSLNYYNATNLSPSTSYMIGTRPVDTAGNINTTWVNQTSKTSMPTTNGTIGGTISYTCNNTGIANVSINLSQGGTIIASTTTDSNGNYMITGLAPGAYTLTTSKLRFWSNSTSVTITAGETVTVQLALWLKGDLDNNGLAADAGDVALMKDASVGISTPDWRYDLNTNSMYADAGDQAMMRDASVGKIVMV